MDPITQKLVPGAAGFIPNHYVDEVFSVDTWFGQGTGTSLTPRDKKITNGIDMARHGGMVWSMQRAVTGVHGSDCYKTISDTDIGVQKRFFATSSDGAMGTQADAMQSFDSDGWTMGTNMFMNEGMNDNSNSSSNLAYTFRKQPGFFDMVTFTTGDVGGKNNYRRINHSLECKPGFWIMKNQTNNGDYYVYHKVQGRSQYAKMNEGGAFSGDSDFWGYTDPTTTDFGVNESAPWWSANSTYSVWMWADGDDADAKLFGKDKDSEIVKQVVVNGQNVLTDIGWEPQMILVLKDGGDSHWFDYLRGFGGETEFGMTSGFYAADLTSNTYQHENVNQAIGANVKGWFNGTFSGQQYCLAIRRPDAKVGRWVGSKNECIHLYQGQSPEAHTFDLHTFIDSSGNQTGFGVQDMEFSMRRYDSGSYNPTFMTTNRLMSGSSNGQGGRDTGVSYGYSRWYLGMNEDSYIMANPVQLRNIRYDLNSEMYDPTQGASNTYGSYIPQYSFGNDSSFKNTDSVFYMFKRKSGFFDMIKYRGVGAFTHGGGIDDTPHALGVKPDLAIIKTLDNQTAYGSYGNWWAVWSRAAGDAGVHDMDFNTAWINNSIIGTRYRMWDSSGLGPGAETFRLGMNWSNYSGMNYIMYLFANCEGVFHTGLYTGAGEGTPVDVTEIGFSPRVLMLRNISSTGAWWVWDSKRGFSSDNDPYLRWNAPARQVSDTDYVDPLPNGFQLTNTAPGVNMKLNVSGEKVLYLAFA
tara:strand:- start:551 stop:2788 length:2238 start_codon:yes stop_codon:yes gene_type:complete